MGRPATNVFQHHLRKRGKIKGGSGPNLKARRSLYLGLHSDWVTKQFYPGRLRSEQLRREGDPDWELFRAAEMAMCMIGRKHPEKVEKRHRSMDNFMPLDHEALAFLRWVRNEVSRNMKRIRGAKPVAEQMFRTALSTLVAKLLIQPKGGNSKTLPSAREIAQVWYVLFGEHESYEAIRARLPQLKRMCLNFDRDLSMAPGSRKPRYLGRLGKALPVRKSR